MNHHPSPIQTLFLWRLLAADGADFLKRIKPELTPKDRRSLEAAGIIQVEKRKESDRKGARPVSYVSLTEQGWEWAAGHLDAEISSRSTAAAFVLHAMLSKLKAHLDRAGVSLADFVCPTDSKVDGRADVARRIREGYCQASGGRWNVRVRLADLRNALADVPRADLDAAIFSAEREGSVVLYPLDDPQEIRPEDRAAALSNTLGVGRHIVCIER